MLFVSATIKAKPDSVALVRSELFKFIAPTLQEDGCHQYLLHQSIEDPATFIFYEEWIDQAALDAHLESDHIKKGIAAMDGHLEDVTVTTMLRVESEK